MRLGLGFAFLVSAVVSTAASESIYDAARLARALVASTGISTLSTTFPSEHPELAGQAVGLMEYHASCFTNGSLTILFAPISLNSKNILKSPTRAASLSVVASPARASNARVSLIGTVDIHYNINDNIKKELEQCYTAVHPDAKRWVPGSEDSHLFYWARFEPQIIYYIGGFGGLHYIGYIPLELYQTSGNLTGTDLRVQA
ncbi:pyridoxamine 5'-phosphate oxidase-domain-containing protein [Auriculariales sp. MPI-PUGE-AT-0066]|nr:pyridoxamine 5'-phosphate oxidase-domain-containing protein [Auriculariales sp. MPI-PUGE-AT-0066]